MNSQLYEAESSIGMDQYVEDHINKLRSWQARNLQQYKNNDLRVQKNESIITSAKPTQEHKAQQTDHLHLDGHLLYTMIARLNAVFTQLITEIQQHHLSQSNMLQNTSLPFQNNRQPAPRRTKRRYHIRKRYRCRQHGHWAAECEAPFPPPGRAKFTYLLYNIQDHQNGTQLFAGSLSAIYPQSNYKTERPRLQSFNLTR